MLGHNAFLAIMAFTCATSCAQYQGFNYGSNNADGSPATQQDFETQFNTARALKGSHSRFTSARLYTMIQSGTANEPISAIPAAINTQTSLLLGMWASAGQESFNNELAALQAAIQTYGQALTRLVAGISVGSEDLYRITPTGIANNAGIGESPKVIAKYIRQTRKILAGTAFSGVKVGHVDTWTAWVNSSNIATINASDFVGVDAYPYFQTVNSNEIENGPSLFEDAYQATINAVSGRPVWITETGWPISGPVSGLAVASTNNSKFYWNAIACKYLGNVNTWWYTLYDGSASPSFGLTGTTLSSQPVFNLRCPKVPRTKQASVSSKATKPSSSGKLTHTASNAGIVSSATMLAPATTSGLGIEGSGCPTSLSEEYQYPHLMVSVDYHAPEIAQGTSYDGRVSSTVSTLFNYDIPNTYQGKTCSLVFFFPRKEDLKISSWTMNGDGGISVQELAGPVSSESSYNTMPKAIKDLGRVSKLAAGNNYILSTEACSAGKTVAYKISAVGSLELNYFQVTDPLPVGPYIVAC